jgi:hypothetical protein
MFKNFAKNLWKKPNPKRLKHKKFWAALSCPHDKRILFLGHNS